MQAPFSFGRFAKNTSTKLDENNDQEEESLVEEYNNRIIDNNNGMYTINTKEKCDIDEYIGTKLLNDEIYKPSKYYFGTPDDKYTTVSNEEATYVTSSEELYNVYELMSDYRPNQGIDFLQFKTINDNGTVEPVKEWVIKGNMDSYFIPSLYFP